MKKNEVLILAAAIAAAGVLFVVLKKRQAAAPKPSTTGSQYWPQIGDGQGGGYNLDERLAFWGLS